jgi:hypothetical protein
VTSQQFESPKVIIKRKESLVDVIHTYFIYMCSYSTRNLHEHELTNTPVLVAVSIVWMQEHINSPSILTVCLKCLCMAEQGKAILTVRLISFL